ncbi:hypothetical protein M2140_001914 [Clostridiales Family XIII bacterium PM5-7]
MKQNELAFNVEELSNAASTVHSIQETLYQAIYGGMDPEAYKLAFVAFGELTEKLAEEMAELKDGLFEKLEE